MIEALKIKIRKRNQTQTQTSKAEKLAATAQFLQARRPVARPEPPLAFHARSTGGYHNFYSSH